MNMKKLTKILAVASVLLIFSTNSFAQAIANSTASARIVTTLMLTNMTNLDFGDLAVSVVGGTGHCILAPEPPTPTRTTSGGVTLPASTGLPRAAYFQVDGSPDQWFTVSFPDPECIITNTTAPTETMQVHLWTTNLVSPVNQGQLDGSGQAYFYVGAQVEVDGSQLPGLYNNLTGFPVRVDYN
jgi:hypothetical protein